MENNETNRQRKGGRKPKIDPSTHRYVFRLTDQENAKFLSLFESSGLSNKARFITSVLFGREIKTVKIDKAAYDYHMQLTQLFGQIRAVGTNYNQVVKILYRNFSERKAGAYLFKLEQQTIELSRLCKAIIKLTEDFQANHINTRHDP